MTEKIRDRSAEQKLITAVSSQELAFSLLTPDEQEALRKGDAMVRTLSDVDLATVGATVKGYLSVLEKITALQDAIYLKMLGQKLS